MSEHTCGAHARAPRSSRLGTTLALYVTLQGCVLDAVGIGHWAADADASDGSRSTPEIDASVPEEAAVPDDAGCSERDACTSDAGAFDSELLTVTPGPNTSYFAGEAALPAGDYRLSYEDGCWKSGVVAWTVNLGPEGYFVVSGEPAEPIVMAPGSVGTFAGLGAFSSYEECVAGNLGQPAVSFSFAGGRLGLRLESTPEDLLVMRFILLQGGESVGGRSPTFRLTCAGSCR
jgi:hypothetical protein